MDAIVAFITQFWADLMPFKIILWYERGAFLRPGKEPKLMMPGFYMKWPFYDTVFDCIITPDTLVCKPSHITTLDDKTAVITPVVDYEITDAMKFMIFNNEARSNFHDTVMGITSEVVVGIVWPECRNKSTKTEIKNKLNKKADDMGVKVNTIYLKDIALCKLIITKV